jgi:hypothetical protein
MQSLTEPQVLFCTNASQNPNSGGPGSGGLTSQPRGTVRRQGGLKAEYLVDVVSYTQVRGLPFRADELVDALAEVIGR